MKVGQHNDWEVDVGFSSAIIGSINANAWEVIPMQIIKCSGKKQCSSPGRGSA